MKILTQMHVVQFSFWEYESFHLRLGGTGFLGPNGAGKTSMVDAIQIAILGGSTKHTHFNTQLAHKDQRTIRDYALGAMRSDNSDNAVISRKREEAISYITLIFDGDKPEHVVSLGICLHATSKEKDHSVLGLYVLPGVRLKLDDHLGAIGQSEKAPLEWPVFEAQIRRMAKEAGRLPTISTNTRTYQQELLHCLQHKGRTIQPEKFARAFAQSLQLKNIQSVNDYLRGYLIDAEQIDKSGTLAHIKNVRRLTKQVAEVKDQIVQLTALEKRFQNLNGHYETVTAAQTVQLQLKVEELDGHIGSLLQKEARLTEELEETLKAQDQKEAEAALLRETWANLLGTFNADPEAKRPEQARALRSARAVAANERKRVAERLAVQIRDSLEKAVILLRANDDPTGEDGLALLEIWEQIHQRGELPPLEMCKEASLFLTQIEPKISTLLDTAIERATFASAALKSAAKRLDAARQGMRLHKGDDRIPTVMALFSDKGIGSTTVASLVTVTDKDWQPAIESFLGGNRFALVVDPGRERDAIHIMRTTAKDIYNVTVVQPEHLRDMIDRPAEPQSVAGLLAGDHKVAVAFLRRCIGRLRQVDTEEELEKFERSMTRDGMLSSNGGTRRIPLIRNPEHWELGASAGRVDVELIREELSGMLEQEKNAKEHLTACREADEAVRRARRECTPSLYQAALTAFAASKDELDAVEVISAEQLPAHLRELQDRIAKTEKQTAAATMEHVALANKGGSIEIELRNTTSSISLSREELHRHQSLLVTTRQGEDYSEEAVVELYTSASKIQAKDGKEVAFTWLRDKEELARKNISRTEPIIRSDFREFISALSINLVEEHSEWRKAWSWTVRHNEKLQKSKLVEYESHAEEARLAADKAFRSDVAYKIRDAIKRVQHDIRELNRILTSCPEFTGGEKYQFREEPSGAYADLYKLIEGSALNAGSALPLEGANEATQAQLLTLLDACETGALKGANPLEDYRLLFNFDLDIYVDGKRVDSLSKRLGVGSNGEHLVPFYVIAGASLANAYGMKPGAEYDGAAIMLIDEAFHGFDAQNTYVTGKFLRSLGLQLVVAAPDADVGKLVPVLDSFYDLNRFGSEVFPIEHVVKDPAKDLLLRDIPGHNPKLVEERIAQLSLIQ